MSAPMEHSPWGASAVKRLLCCPGSHGLSALAGGENRSSWAAEGSVAHTLGEDCHLLGRKPTDYLGRAFEKDGYSITVDQGMCDAVQVYLDLLAELERTHGPLRLEQRVSLDSLWPGGEPPVPVFGTSDCIAVSYERRHMTVADYKHGAGVPVDLDPQEGNEQLFYYARGAMLSLLSPVDTVEIIIVQPRAPHKDGPVRRATFAALDIIMWADDILFPGLARTLEPDAPLRAGRHCRFCPAKGFCPEYQPKPVRSARDDFPECPE